MSYELYKEKSILDVAFINLNNAYLDYIENDEEDNRDALRSRYYELKAKYEKQWEKYNNYIIEEVAQWIEQAFKMTHLGMYSDADYFFQKAKDCQNRLAEYKEIM